MIKGITVREMIGMLKEYPMDAEVKLSMIVDTNKLTEDDSCGDIEGIYFVNGISIGVEVSIEDDDIPVILAEDNNYDGICEKEFMS